MSKVLKSNITADRIDFKPLLMDSLQRLEAISRLVCVKDTVSDAIPTFLKYLRLEKENERQSPIVLWTCQQSSRYLTTIVSLPVPYHVHMDTAELISKVTTVHKQRRRRLEGMYTLACAQT
jgi:hypothetical protein